MSSRSTLSADTRDTFTGVVQAVRTSIAANRMPVRLKEPMRREIIRAQIVAGCSFLFMNKMRLPDPPLFLELHPDLVGYFLRRILGPPFDLTAAGIFAVPFHTGTDDQADRIRRRNGPGNP